MFTAEHAARIDQSNLMQRVLKPAAVAAGVGTWVGYHTFRHTCASCLFRSGWNAVQVQKFLGHHKASFTLDTYIHLLEVDIPEPVPVATAVATSPTEISRYDDDANEAQTRVDTCPVSVAL